MLRPLRFFKLKRIIIQIPDGLPPRNCTRFVFIVTFPIIPRDVEFRRRLSSSKRQTRVRDSNYLHAFENSHDVGDLEMEENFGTKTAPRGNVGCCAGRYEVSQTLKSGAQRLKSEKGEKKENRRTGLCKNAHEIDFSFRFLFSTLHATATVSVSLYGCLYSCTSSFHRRPGNRGWFYHSRQRLYVPLCFVIWYYDFNYYSKVS